MTDKSDLSERDICTKFITPALVSAGWDLMTQIREEVTLTPGPIMVRGNVASRNKKKKKFADYVLYKKPNVPIGVIEAKDNNHTVGDGMQQALGYADILNVPSAYSSNGDAFLSHNKTAGDGEIEVQINMDAFPAPDELWQRYKQWTGLEDEHQEIVEQDYHFDGSGKEPRYYQVAAINSVLEALAKGQDRLLLVMATGSGKTLTAFQIIWRLWKLGRTKRILYLADRNILLDQTIVNDFKPFGTAMTKIRNRNIDKSYEIYLSLYQAISGTEEADNVYKEFSPNFFDLIVIDECHRGSAKDDAAWREILEYFSSAIQIGMTATPKETKYVSSTSYFGEPVFTYSLRQGIEDGFLAPYKVIRIDIDKDVEGWTPPPGMIDDLGAELEAREYNQLDMDRILVLNQRTKLVAERVMAHLKKTDPLAKTIVFCEDIDHAERMRSALVNAAGTLAVENSKYVMRITGDSKEGKAELDNFIDPEASFPVIATTSELLSTGVDAITCKLIVLDKTINSVSMFKQIIGRGTRVNEDYNKFFFTIMDFKRATENFFDPEFDGDPVVIFEPGAPDGPTDDDPTDGDDFPGDDGGGGTRKYYVGGVEVSIRAERVSYIGADGDLITQSLKDYTKGRLGEQFSSLDDFVSKWSEAKQKTAIIDELAEGGVFFEEMEEEVGGEYGAFDLICHVAYDQPPLTRRERVENVRKRNYFTKYGDMARAVLDALLDKYADEGIGDVEDMNVLRIDPINQIGTAVEIVREFGGKDGYLKAVHELENELYRAG